LCNASTKGCSAHTRTRLDEASSRRRREAADPEGKNHPDLLVEEESVESTRWSGRRRGGARFAQGGDGDTHRRQPESVSGGGGDPVASELGGERG
jgi:hypothetical protein